LKRKTSKINKFLSDNKKKSVKDIKKINQI
jgi:hypothetical protein